VVWHGDRDASLASVPLATGVATVHEDVSPVAADRLSLSCCLSNSDVLILTFTFRTQPMIGQETISDSAAQQIGTG
jgi:hypothetical protein